MKPDRIGALVEQHGEYISIASRGSSAAVVECSSGAAFGVVDPFHARVALEKSAEGFGVAVDLMYAAFKVPAVVLHDYGIEREVIVGIDPFHPGFEPGIMWPLRVQYDTLDCISVSFSEA